MPLVCCNIVVQCILSFICLYDQEKEKRQGLDDKCLSAKSININMHVLFIVVWWWCFSFNCDPNINSYYYMSYFRKDKTIQIIETNINWKINDSKKWRLFMFICLKITPNSVRTRFLLQLWFSLAFKWETASLVIQFYRLSARNVMRSPLKY